VIACVFLPDLVSRVIGNDVLLVTTTGFVQASSRGAVKRGVQLGMRIQQARVLCPDADVSLFDEAPFQDVGEAIETILLTFSTRMEAVFGSYPLLQRSTISTWENSEGAMR
jgi:hypothetical protein